MPKEKTSSETAMRLVAAAILEFNERGYFHTDTNRIAKRAGFAPGTFYRYFADKKAILLAAYRDHVVRDWEELAGLVDGAGHVEDLLPRFVDTVLKRHRAWRGIRAGMRSLQHHDDEVMGCYRQQKRWQLLWIENMLGALGGGPRTMEENYCFLVSFERICDSLANDEPRRLRLKRPRLRAYLEDLLRLHVGADRAM